MGKKNNMSGIRTFVPNTSKKDQKNIKYPWYLRVYEVVDKLNTNTEKGLNLQEAQRRRKKTGYNLLYPEFKRTFKSAFIDHIKTVSSSLLAISLFVFFAFLGEKEYLISALIITFSLLIDCIIEHFSSLSLSKARKNASLKAYVKRNGTLYSIDSRFLVPGDIVYLQKGSIVPADIRLFDSNGLIVYETPISGNEMPILKVAKDIVNNDSTDETPLNMAFAGSIVSDGNAWGIVCFTGQDTKFTNLPKNKHDNVPALFKYVYSVSSMLSIVSTFIGALMLTLGLFFSSSMTSSFLFSLTISSCCLCDSILSFSALSFSSGISEMEKNGAVLRNLSAVENISFIDTFLGHQSTLFPIQKIELDCAYMGKDVAEGDIEKKLIKHYLLCSDVKKHLSKKNNKNFEYRGKQNSIAVARYGNEIGLNIDQLNKEFLVTEVQHIENDDFSSILAYENGQKYLFVKGNAEDILDLCKYHVTSNGVKTLSDDDSFSYRNFIKTNTNETGYFIGLAKCETAIDKLSEYDYRKVLTLYGFVKFKTYFGIDYFKDVDYSHKSGIEVCMFSSDAYSKAYNLGKNAGIFQKNSQVITEEEIRFFTRDEIETYLPTYKLFLNFTAKLFNLVVTQKKKNNKIVAISAETTEDLSVMKNSNLSFVVDGESTEMIKQSSDVILSSGGFDKINNVVSSARKIYRRIHSICEYCVYNYLSILFLYFVGKIFGIKYHVSDFIIYSIIISGTVLCHLATANIKEKNNYFRPQKRKKIASPLSFLTPTLLAIGLAFSCPLICSFYGSDTSHSLSLIYFTVYSFFASIVILNEGNILSKHVIGIHYKTIFYVLSLVSFFSIIFFIPQISKVLLLNPVSISSLATVIIVPIIFIIILTFAIKTIKK